ncbi:MAG: universal stress protein [Bacteroidetes bacterium]|nr:universal stress protein [Bacteroidota bacterium]
MKTILVPTDFSDAAKNASIYAAEFAKSIRGKIILYHAYHLPIMITTDTPTTVMMDMQMVEEENLERLKKEAHHLKEKTGVDITYRITEGFAVDEILEIERSQNPDLIIMGMQQSQPLNEFLVGGIATDVIRQSLVPVMIIPLGANFKQFKKIVFATDYNIDTDIHLLEPLKEFAKIFYAKLFILNIVKELELVGVEKEVSRMRIQNYFEDLDHTHYYFEDTDIIHGLNEFIEEYEIDIVTMLPHRHNLFKRMFSESYTKKMAFHTHIPLLTMPSRSL